MELWAVIGFDAMYEGLHGMIEYNIIEGTEEDAAEEGEILSYAVINSYPDIYESLEERIEEYLCDESEIGFEDEDNIRDEVYGNDVAFDYYRLDTSKLPTLDIEELQNMIYCDSTTFLEKYAIDY